MLVFEDKTDVLLLYFIKMLNVFVIIYSIRRDEGNIQNKLKIWCQVFLMLQLRFVV